MSKRQITGLIIGIVFVGLIAYDVFAYFNGGNSTISEWIWAASKSYPLIPFGAGIISGHLFWQA